MLLIKKTFYHSLTCLIASFLVLTMLCTANSGIVKNTNLEKKRTKDTVITLRIPTMVVSLSEKKESVNSWDKNMPWIIALMVGVVAAVVNLIMNYNSRRTTLEITKNQLDNATRLAVAQIEQTRLNSERDFNKTVLSGNRQVWINDFRNLMSEIISTLESFIIMGDLKDEQFSVFRILITKAELMLTEDADASFVQVLLNTQKYCLNIVQHNSGPDELENIIRDIKSRTLEKIKLTWEQVKSGK